MKRRRDNGGIVAGEFTELKKVRVKSLLSRVRRYMSDGQKHTLAEIAFHTGGSEASCSARLRDMRKPEYGGVKIKRELLPAKSDTWLYWQVS